MSKIDYIAEIGSNHGGSIHLALEHIVAARQAGATGVKFQLFRAESLDSRPEVQAQLRPYELPLEWLPILRDYAHALKLTFGVTPLAIDLVEPLRGVVDWVKISAYDLTFDDLLLAAVELGVPIVRSVAMSTAEEINRFPRLVPSSCPQVFLVGVAQYPARLEDHSLRRLKKLIFRSRVGLSDHTLGYEAAMLSVALGGTWIEKHFKLWDRTPSTSPDFAVSATEGEFRQMVQACERAKAACGAVRYGPLPCEMPLYTTCRRSNEKRLRG